MKIEVPSVTIFVIGLLNGTAVNHLDVLVSNISRIVELAT